MTKLTAITLWQPWASLVACGAKSFETRAYPPPAKLIGQRIAIHAAKKDWRETLLGLESSLVHQMENTLDEWVCNLPLGAVVCTAVLRGAYRVASSNRLFHYDERVAGSPEVLRVPSRTEAMFGDFSPGRWAWHLTDVEPLDPPVPARGMQGFWTWEQPS